MFKAIWSGFVNWWCKEQKENEFVHDTLSELHRKLLVFDRETDFWTHRSSWYISICRGEKFPLYLYGKVVCLCTVTLEKKMGQWFWVVEYVYCPIDKRDYPVANSDQMVIDLRRHYDV